MALEKGNFKAKIKRLLSQFLYEAIVRDTSPPPKSIKIEEEEIIFDKGEIERSLKRTISVQQ